MRIWQIGFSDHTGRVESRNFGFRGFPFLAISKAYLPHCFRAKLRL
jgi:hypothetical protein